jgi:hypothetical protein
VEATHQDYDGGIVLKVDGVFMINRLIVGKFTCSGRITGYPSTGYPSITS